MSFVEGLIRPFVRSMSAYSPVEPPDQIAMRLGMDERAIIKLDANENPYGTSPKVLKALGEAKYLHIYPDPSQVQLRKQIAGYAQCLPENIVAGTGADELLDLCCRLVIGPGDRALGFAPTFSYYPHIVTLNGGEYNLISREGDFSISLEKIKSYDLNRVKLVLLCSPNNPSGNLIEEEVLYYFLQKEILVILDEAYFEFAGKSYSSLIKEYENLIVLRTFSKCFALAGLRVGYGIMSPQLAQVLMRIKPPYSVNIAGETAVLHCLEDLDYYQNQVNRMIDSREWLLQELEKLSEVEVTPSYSNFILCRVLSRPAIEIKEELENKGILIRYYEGKLLKNHLRISIGTKEQLEVFLKAFVQLL